MTYLTDCNWMNKPYLDSKENHHPTTPSLFKQTASKILKIKNSIFFTIIFVAFAGGCWGQAVDDYGSIAKGDWNGTSTWGIWDGTAFSPTTSYPNSASTNVFINNGFLITINGPFNVKNLTINSGGELTLGSYTLTVVGDFINNGTFTKSLVEGLVIMKGSSDQKIGGSSVTDFWNLQISNTYVAVTASNSFNVINKMNIEYQCTFNPASSVLINGTAASGTLSGSGTAKITGSGIASGDYFSQYKFLNYPVSNIEYNGGSAQVISPFAEYNTLKINNASGCTLFGDATCKFLTVTSGVLTVLPNSTFRQQKFSIPIYDDNGNFLRYQEILGNTNLVHSDSCVVLQSNASSTGSFIFDNDVFQGIGTVKVKRFMSKTDNWHLYSSPMKDQSVHSFLQTNLEIPDLWNTDTKTIIGVGMRDYDTANDCWKLYQKTTSDPFNPYFIYENTSIVPGSIGGGKGFSIRTYNDSKGTGNIDAIGIPNQNIINVVLTRTSATADKGWNCIGNPFCCAINMAGQTGFLGINSNSLDPAFLSVYLWDGTISQYVVINNASSITSVQTGQGFFVKSKVGGGSASFNKGMQSSNSGLTFKEAILDWPSIKILVQNQSLKNSTDIKFIKNTTKGLDPGYDAGMLKANPDFALYSRLLEDNGIDFAMQSLPDQNFDQYVIPIGIDFKVGGDITFTVETINLPSGCQALLEDRLTKRFTRLDLKDTKYTTTVSANTKGTGRFFLHASDVISGDQPIEKERFKISKIGKTLYINGEVSKKANFFVYSVNGKQLANFKAESQVQTQFDASGLPAGVYILTCDDQNQKKSTKFVIEN